MQLVGYASLAFRRAATGVLALWLTGCATFSADGGFATVEQVARDRLGKDIRWVRTDAEQQTLAQRVGELVSKPLSVDDAVQIALLNNRGLQASYFDLGISESNLVQAGRLPNPHFSMMRTSLVEDGVRHYSIEQVLSINVFALLTMPQTLKVERRRFEQAQRSVSLDVVRIASDTRKAYYAALAAEESVRYAQQVNQVAQVSADLARRMRDVGNFSKLQQAREQSFYADAILNLARAERVRVAARERLTRLLGLSGEQTRFSLPERLPDLPKAPNELANVEQTAMEQRIDLQMVRLETEALASNLGLTRATRFINVFEAGFAREREGPRGAPWANGYEISFQIPLFDFGTARVARSEAVYMQAVNRAAEAAVNARSEVREAYLGYRTNYDIARHFRDEIVPLRQRIADENLLRYNGMLIGVFELLADARAQIASVNASIEGLRDFWIAHADLEMAMIGRPNMSAAPSAGSKSPEAGAAH
ncbi:MAG TPA: TolC family protein [Burkholderiaceae bacterium]|nr:TolC family protein [Burkholderiaceae bacterium]